MSTATLPEPATLPLLDRELLRPLAEAFVARAAGQASKAAPLDDRSRRVVEALQKINTSYRPVVAKIAAVIANEPQIAESPAADVFPLGTFVVGTAFDGDVVTGWVTSLPCEDSALTIAGRDIRGDKAPSDPDEPEVSFLIGLSPGTIRPATVEEVIDFLTNDVFIGLNDAPRILFA